MNCLFVYPPFQKKRLSYAQSQAFYRLDNPIGDPFGGPAFRQYNSSGFWGGVTSSVSGVVNSVGDAFAKIDKEVLQPVTNAVGSIGQAIANDPLTFMAQIAAVALAPTTGGMSLWAIPVIQGASVAAHGGTFEDVLKASAISAATVYVGGQVSSYVMNGMSTASSIGPSFSLAGNTISFSTAQAISNVAGYSLASGLGAAAAGKNSSQILSTALASGVGAALPAVVANIPGFSDLSSGSVPGISADVGKAIQNSLIQTAGGALTAVVTGKDVATAATSALLSSAIDGIISTKNVVTEMFASAGQTLGLDKLSSPAQAIVANTVTSVLSSAALGGSSSQALSNAFMSVATQTIANTVKNNGGLINTITNAAKSAYDFAQTKLSEYTGISEEYEGTIEERNVIAEQAEGERIRQEALLAQRDESIDTWEFLRDGAEDLKETLAQQRSTLNSTASTLNNKANQVKGLADTQQQWLSKFNTYKSQLDSYSKSATHWANLANAERDHMAIPGIHNQDNINYHMGNYNSYVANYNNYNNLAQQAATNANNAAGQANYYAGLAGEAQKEYGTIKSNYDNLLEEYKTIGYSYEEAVNKANAEAVKVETITTDINNITKNYEDYYVPTIEEADKKIAELETGLKDSADAYVDAAKSAEEAAKPLADQMTELQNQTTRTLVSTFDPNFNEAEYKKINGLGDAIDGYSHWLVTGKNQGLYTNYESASVSLQDERTRLINEIAKSQGYDSILQISNEDWDEMYSTIQSKYGDNLAALKAATSSNVVKQGESLDTVLRTYKPEDSNQEDMVGDAYGEWNKPADYTPPEGTRLATAEEVAKGKAKMITTEDRQSIWVSSTGEEVLKQFDVNTGDMTFKPLQIEIRGTGESAGENVVESTDLMDMDPWAMTQTFASFSKEDEPAIVKILPNAADIIDAAKSVTEWAKSTGNGTVQNIVSAAIVNGGAEALKTFSELAKLTGEAPENTTMYKLGEELLKLGNSNTTEEFQANVVKFNALLEKAQGLDVIPELFKAIDKYPAEFFIGIVGKEVVQEAVPFLLGAGAGKAVAWGAKLSGMSSAMATSLGSVAGMKASQASDIVESYGSTAQEARQDAYNTAMASGKYTPEQAAALADKVGVTSGAVAAIATMVGFKYGGNAINEVFFGGKASSSTISSIVDWMGNAISSGATIAYKEGRVEAIEEVMASIVTDMQLLPIDPSRDVTKNTALSASMGFIVGGTTAGSVMGISSAKDLINYAIDSADPVIKQTLESATSLNGYLGVLSSLGISDSALQAEFANAKFGDQVTTAKEAQDALNSAGLVDITEADARNIAGVSSAQETASKASAYADANMIDATELQAIAAQQGYTLSEDDIAKMTGRAVETEATTKYGEQFDQLAVVKSEAEEILKGLGYTAPTEAEVAQFIKSTPELQVKAEAAAYVDPRQVTATEAESFFKSIGYTPTQEEVKQFVQQGAETQQAIVKKALEDYADPRFVDAAEAKAALDNMGLTGYSEQDIASLTGQYQESELEGKTQQAMPGIVQRATEAKIEAAKNEVINKVAANENAGMARDEAISAAVDKVAGDLGTTRSDLLEQIGATETTIGSRIDALQQQTQSQIAGMQSAIEAQMKKNMDAGMASDAALNKAIQDVAAQSNTTAQNMLAQMGMNQQQLLNTISASQTQTQQQIADTKKAILDQMQAYQSANMDADTALDLAISGVAQDLGLTRANLVSQIGTTEANLRAEFTQQTAAVSQQVQDVAKLLGKPASQVTAADVQAVQGMIGGQAATNLAYDTNNDGKVDQTDLTNIQNKLAFDQNTNIKQQVDPETGITAYIDTTTGKEVSPPTIGGSQWTSTGIYEILEKEKDQAAATAKAAAAKAKTAQQKSQFGQLMGMLFQAPDIAGQQVAVKTPDPAKIGYIYDFSSIFANPSQASMMPSPYGPVNTVAPKQPQQAANQPLFQLASGFAEGGIVNSNDIQVGESMDDLINILKGN